MQLHPTIARSFLTDSVIMMKDPKRGFPVDSSMTVVRWRLVNGGEDYLPLNVTCWPEAIDNGFDVEENFDFSAAELLSSLPKSLTDTERKYCEIILTNSNVDDTDVAMLLNISNVSVTRMKKKLQEKLHFLAA